MVTCKLLSDVSEKLESLKAQPLVMGELLPTTPLSLPGDQITGSTASEISLPSIRSTSGRLSVRNTVDLRFL